MTKTSYVVIGNGLYARVKAQESYMESYRRKQETCKHDKRDYRGMCYACGHILKGEVTK